MVSACYVVTYRGSIVIFKNDQIEPTHISLTLDLITTCCFIGKQIQIQTS